MGAKHHGRRREPIRDPRVVRMDLKRELSLLEHARRQPNCSDPVHLDTRIAVIRKALGFDVDDGTVDG